MSTEIITNILSSYKNELGTNFENTTTIVVEYLFLHQY